MDRLYQDLRFSLRLLRKDLAFAVTAILTLSLCVGANAAIFAVVNSVLLKPLPVPEPDRLVLIHNSYPRAGVVRASNGVPDYYDRLRETDVFEEQALYNTRGVTIGIDGDPQRVTGMIARPSLLRMLRATASRGRLFREDEGEQGSDRKVVLTHALWQQLYGGADSALGRELRINGLPHEIIGILPAGFHFASAGYQTLDAVVLQPGRKVRRFAAQQQLVDDRAAQAWRHRHAGPAADRRAERAESRALPQSARGAHQRGIPYGRQVVSAGSHRGRPRNALSPVGRRSRRAAHRSRQHHQSGHGAIERAGQGAGDPPGARRRSRAADASTPDRDGRPDARGCRIRTAPRIQRAGLPHRAWHRAHSPRVGSTHGSDGGALHHRARASSSESSSPWSPSSSCGG